MTSKELEPLKLQNDAKIDVHDDDGNQSLLKNRKQSNIRGKAKRFFVKNAFMILTFIGVIIGFILGFGIRVTNPSTSLVHWLQMPGTIYIRLLTQSILPLIVGSVIMVTSKLDPKANGRISLISFAYIVVANVSCSVIGLVLAVMIKPGSISIKNETLSNVNPKSLTKLTSSDVFSDLILNIFPDNIVAACLFKTQTMYQQKFDQSIHTLIKVINDSMNGNDTQLPLRADRATLDQAMILEERVHGNVYAMNMIGVIFVSCSFGIAARLCGEKAKPFLTFFDSVTEVVTVVMRGFLWLTPIGVCFMIAGSVAAVDSIIETFSRLGLLVVTVVTGLFIHFILMNLAVFFVSWKNPLRLLPYSFPSWFISFITTVPVISIPEMYEGCDKFGMSRRVSRVVVPFAAAMKGDGSAIFITAACVFTAQMAEFPLTLGDKCAIVLLMSATAMALPNVPSGAIVIIMTIMSSIGCPTQTVALLFAMEWLMDRMRSGNIGLSHMYCTAFTNYLCKDKLNQESDTESKMESSVSGSTKHVDSGDNDKCLVHASDDNVPEENEQEII